LDPCKNSTPNTKLSRYLIPLLQGKSPFWCRSSLSSWIYFRWSKLFKKALPQAKGSLTCQTGQVRRASRRQNFFLFQSNSTLGQISTKANKSQALIRSWELFSSLTYTNGSLLPDIQIFRPHIHRERHHVFNYICTRL
jgi:hypothetical protein